MSSTTLEYPKESYSTVKRFHPRGKNPMASPLLVSW